MGLDPNCVDFEGNTPLHITFSIFSKEPVLATSICVNLLSFGADPNVHNKDLWTPLHIAVKKNQKEALKFALSYNK
jgi:ankyrin repeat protein